jgi:hypothetical protein
MATILATKTLRNPKIPAFFSNNPKMSPGIPFSEKMTGRNRLGIVEY